MCVAQSGEVGPVGPTSPLCATHIEGGGRGGGGINHYNYLAVHRMNAYSYCSRQFL